MTSDFWAEVLTFLLILGLGVCLGVVIGVQVADNVPTTPVVIDLLFEDELCTDINYNQFTDTLTAEVWRGDPDTCTPLAS